MQLLVKKFLVSLCIHDLLWRSFTRSIHVRLVCLIQLWRALIMSILSVYPGKLTSWAWSKWSIHSCVSFIKACPLLVLTLNVVYEDFWRQLDGLTDFSGQTWPLNFWSPVCCTCLSRRPPMIIKVGGTRLVHLGLDVENLWRQQHHLFALEVCDFDVVQLSVLVFTTRQVWLWLAMHLCTLQAHRWLLSTVLLLNRRHSEWLSFLLRKALTATVLLIKVSCDGKLSLNLVWHPNVVVELIVAQNIAIDDNLDVLLQNVEFCTILLA